MATDKLINQSQGDDIIDRLNDIADNIQNIQYGLETSSDNVVAMTGYQKASTAGSISETDTLNEAIGKLEKKIDDSSVDDKVDGPDSATVGNIAVFDNVDGKSIDDSGISVKTSLDNSKDTEVPTSKAVDTYITSQGFAKGVSSSTANNLVAFNTTDGKTLKDSGVGIATSSAGIGDSDTAVPTSKAVKNYVDATISGTGRYLGTATAVTDLSTSAKEGDYYVVSTAWTGVHVCDVIIAKKDNPSQSIDDTNWSLLHNESNTDANVEQSPVSTNAEYEVLFSHSANNTSETSGVGKDDGITYNPSTNNLTLAGTMSAAGFTGTGVDTATSGSSASGSDTKVPSTKKLNEELGSVVKSVKLTSSDANPITPTNNVLTIPAFVGSGTGHKAGLVPDTDSSTAGTTKYLREDGSWVEPTGDDLKLTGYEIESQAAAVAATDTINEGIGKLEYKVDANNADIQSILDGTTIDSFSDVETALSGKQATLSTAQLAAVNSGIDNTKVGRIATNTSDISSLQDAVDTKLDKTANAASAAKLNNGTTDYAVGSATKGVYFNNGVPTAMTHSVGTDVPENAVFTDTTYSSGTGITVNASNAINHSNSVSEKTTPSALKVAYDAQGHITGSSPLTASDVGAIATTAKGVANGVAELDSTGKVPSSQLPSYVDDVLEYSAKSSFPATGESGKIYVDTTTNLTYRWSGTAYVEISPSLALGTTSSTAYYGDKGKTAYDHSQITSGNPHNVTKTDVGLGNVGNFKAVSTVASQGLSDQEKIDARANIGAGTSSLVIGTAATQAAAGNHAHGNITNAGALQTTDVAIANGDKLVVTDASNSNKVARTSAAFDGSTTTKCLTQKGTFETFGTSNLILGTTAGTAAEGNHTHTKSQITDFPSSMTPTSHTHGNIQNGGTLQTTDVTIASGDKIIVTDSSDSNKIARTSISFDGSTATQALTKKGTWETFNNYSHPTTSGNKHIPSGGSSGQILRWSADGTAAWGSDNNTWTAMVGATSSANGSVGYVNAVPPKDGYNTKYLRADGSWQVPPNTTYSSKSAASGGTDVSLCTTGEKYTWNSKAAGSHTHGNIQNGGTLQTNDITIARGDKLVVTDSSDSSKIARTSISFDGSTATQALTKKGTFENFQAPISASNKLSSDFVDDTNKTHRFATADQLTQIATNQTNILSVEDMICDTEFSTSTAYAAGDIVTYEHGLYAFTTDHSAGAWNSAEVDEVTAVDLIASGGGTDSVASKEIYVTKPINQPDTWETKRWYGLDEIKIDSLYGRYIWTDGENIYYSNSSNQYVLNKSASTWSEKTWYGLTNYYGDYVWTDGENIYYSYQTDQYVLDKTTDTWVSKSWNGEFTQPDGGYIWTDGENIYYSSGPGQGVLNKATSTWSAKSWSGLTDFSGFWIWTDGNDIYCSAGSDQYVLNKSTSTWETKTWSGLTSFYGGTVWTDGENIYSSNSSNQYVLNKSTSTWETKTWSGLTNFSREDIWTDGENVYYSRLGNYVLKRPLKTTKIPDVKNNAQLTALIGDINSVLEAVL